MVVDFQADLLATCFGNLLSAFVALLGYLLFELWFCLWPASLSGFLPYFMHTLTLPLRLRSGPT